MSDITVEFGDDTPIDVTFDDGTSVPVSFTAALSVPVSFSAGGDMSSSVYDPTSVVGDVFDLSNHHSGTMDDPLIIIDGGLL